ncbi:MAG: hypothetical protein QOG38_1436 [Hyphomicrobiales bacterium]|jgi:hypothetical protein|nr:hypothetical protein [Hyphomicrobiales bacterium]
MKSSRLGLTLAIVMNGTAAAQSPTPPVATNQCWDISMNQLRDKNSAAMGAREGQDRSAGVPAPPSGNAATGGPRNPNAVRPPGVADC